jgi:aspartate kinase
MTPKLAAPENDSVNVVMKFGGTSVADATRITEAARRLVLARKQGHPVIGVVSAMGDTTDELLTLAKALSETPQPRELDMLLSVGEQTACALLAIAIAQLGCDAISLTGRQAGILTTTEHGRAKIVEVAPRSVEDALAQGRIPLVAGFQGISTVGEITTLGRGGSDATAVALAAALKTCACVIYTDVEGVFTADPRIVRDARKLDSLDYDEMLELAGAGARVLQLRAVELARDHGVELEVRSSYIDALGTRIHAVKTRAFERGIVTAVAHSCDEALFRVANSRQAELFTALAGAGVSLDTIIRIDAEHVFSVAAADGGEVTDVLGRAGLRFAERTDLGRVTAVGAGMKSHPGIAAAFFDELARLGVEGEFVSTSPIKISCYLPREHVERAVVALHRRFGLNVSASNNGCRG